MYDENVTYDNYQSEDEAISLQEILDAAGLLADDAGEEHIATALRALDW